MEMVGREQMNVLGRNGKTESVTERDDGHLHVRVRVEANCLPPGKAPGKWWEQESKGEVKIHVMSLSWTRLM